MNIYDTEFESSYSSQIEERFVDLTIFPIEVRSFYFNFCYFFNGFDFLIFLRRSFSSKSIGSRTEDVIFLKK